MRSPTPKAGAASRCALPHWVCSVQRFCSTHAVLVRAVHQLTQHVFQRSNALLLGLHPLSEGLDLLQQCLQGVLLLTCGRQKRPWQRAGGRG